MIRVLLVDDEPFILQGLSVLVEWETLGFEIAAMAANGMEALNYLETNEVDLILADIKMPLLSGVDLLERIRTSQISQAYFVFLSGYRDFEYAKKAIQYGSMDYILKPVVKSELLQILSNVKKLCYRDREKKEQDVEKERKYYFGIFHSVLMGKQEKDYLQYIQGRLRLGGRMRYLILEEKQGYGREDKAADRSDALYEQVSKLMPEYEWHWIQDGSGNDSGAEIGFLYCSFMADEAKLSEKEYLDNLPKLIDEKTGVVVEVYAGSPIEQLSNLPESYRSAMMVRVFQNFRISRMSRETYWEKDGKNTGTPLLCKERLDYLIDAIEENNREKIPELVEALFEEMNTKSMDMRLVELNMNYLLFRLLHLVQGPGDQAPDTEIINLLSAGNCESDSMEGSAKHLLRFSEEYAEYLVHQRGISTRNEIFQEIDKYMKEHYNENLTLKELGKLFFMNSAYLGQQFRKHYGLPFKDYLNQYRIEMAASFLLHTNMKNYEIAEKVGYHDLDYFINRFITVKGCTPAKFRKQAREKV